MVAIIELRIFTRFTEFCVVKTFDEAVGSPVDGFKILDVELLTDRVFGLAEYESDDVLGIVDDCFGIVDIIDLDGIEEVVGKRDVFGGDANFGIAGFLNSKF